MKFTFMFLIFLLSQCNAQRYQYCRTSGDCERNGYFYCTKDSRLSAGYCVGCTTNNNCWDYQYCEIKTGTCLLLPNYPFPTHGPLQSFPLAGCDSSGWSYYDGYDIFDNDLTFIESNNQQNCFLICEKNPSCKGFSWTAHNENPNLKPRCYLKTVGATHVRQKIDVYSAYMCTKQNPTPQPTSSPNVNPTSQPTSSPNVNPTPQPTSITCKQETCNGLCDGNICTVKCNRDTDCFSDYICETMNSDNRLCVRKSSSSSYIYKPNCWILILFLFLFKF